MVSFILANFTRGLETDQTDHVCADRDRLRPERSQSVHLVPNPERAQRDGRQAQQARKRRMYPDRS